MHSLGHRLDLLSVKRKPVSVTQPRRVVPRPQKLRMPAIVFFRAFLLGGVSIAACIWAIWRHYTVPLPSMLAPVPSATETEIEVEP